MKKVYSFDLTATLKSLKKGESIDLRIIGKKREATLQGLYAARKRHHLALSIERSEDQLTAKVTAL